MTVIRINGSSTGNQPQGSDVAPSITLGDLNDVNVTGVANNSIIKYQSSSGNWIIGVDTSTGITAVVEDTSPELGGNLDVLARSIVSSSNRDITLAPNGTGQVAMSGGTTNASPVNITYNDDGALVGPKINLTRVSASPADNDIIGGIEFRGKDSAGNTDTYASIRGMIGRPNSTSERGVINFNALNNGAEERVMSMSRKGLFLNAGNDLYFDGSTDDDFNTQLSATDPSENRLIRLPNLNGTLLIDESDGGLLKLQKADDGAGGGPDIVLERTSASPATDDLLGSIIFKGNDSAGNIDQYASITGRIGRTNSGSERGLINFNAMNNGSDEIVMTMGRNGLFMGAGNVVALGGDSANFFTSLYVVDPTADRTITFPDTTGTVMLNLVEDTTPQLGDHLDVNGKKITSVSNGDIELEPNGSGKIILDGSIDIEGDRANSNSLFINNDMSSNLADDLHNTIECQSDYTGTSIGTGTRQQSITLSFKDDTATRQAGRFNCEFTSTDPSANKMKLIAIDHATSGAVNGQIDISPKVASVNKPFELQSYTVANLPTAGIGAGAMAYCTNDAGGAVPVFYDGSAWRRVTDRTVSST